MKRAIAWFILMTLAVTTVACDVGSVRFGQVKTGPTVTDQIDVPVPDGATISEVEISMGAGNLSIDTGDIGGLVRGTVAYNVEELRPSVQTSGSRVVIEQGDLEGTRIPLGNWSDVENHWDLMLGSAPMELTVNAGAAEAKLANLAGLSASAIAFRGGAGDFSLGFGGELQQDMRVEIDAGAAKVTIIVPEGTAAELTFEGALTNIDAGGAWQKSGSKYLLAGDGPRITFHVQMGLGELDLRND
ncbi:MAG: toast rack family protein [Anaerolineae bacterium]|jgi:hypothetical protein